IVRNLEHHASVTAKQVRTPECLRRRSAETPFGSDAMPSTLTRHALVPRNRGKGETACTCRRVRLRSPATTDPRPAMHHGGPLHFVGVPPARDRLPGVWPLSRDVLQVHAS